MLRLAILTTLLGTTVALPVAAGEEAKRSPPDGRSEQAADSSRPAEPEAAWEVQFSGRGGLAGLVSRGEIRLALASTLSSIDETVGYSREGSWGAGLRVIRGRWGVEVQHHRVAGRAFTPAAMMRETSRFGTQDLTLTDSADDLLSVFALREFPLHDQRARFFLAAGGGYLLMGKDSGRMVLDDVPSGISRSGSFDGASDEAPIAMTERDFRADRGVVIFGASLGLTLRMGRMLLRPRFDAFLGQARSAEESWDMHFDLAEGRDQTATTMTLNTAVRPRFFLFSVDVGWSSRR